MRFSCFFCLFFFASSVLSAQAVVSGFVRDAETKEGLPFVSVYVEEDMRVGAASNLDGYYELALPVESAALQAADSVTVVFQYVGYQTEKRRISLERGRQQMDLLMSAIAIPLGAVEVRADAEDPAYAIMRKVIARRKEVKQGRPAHTCEVYVKGLIRLLDTPEQIFGEELGDLGGILDTAGQGVLYFSESLSRLLFLPPDRFHEQVLASRVSGSDDFGINSSLNANLDLYENVLPFPRPVVSPIADQALRFYRYRLEGTYYDEAGREINRISCRPRVSGGPGFSGTLYVLDGAWLLTGAELSISGDALNEPALDRLAYQMNWVSLVVEGREVWLLLAQSLRFSGAVMGFEFGGYFINRYGAYAFRPKEELQREVNRGEVFVVLPDAAEKGQELFDSLRPLPLTQEEALDYRKKDSLKAVWESPAYLDSLDREANRFTFRALLLGYTHYNSRKWRSWGILSPLQEGGFSAVQGINYGSAVFFKQSYDKRGSRYWKATLGGNWGFAEKVFRPYASFVFQFNELNRAKLGLDAGMRVRSLNNLPVPTFTQNELTSLYARRNLMRMYEYSSVGLSWEQELWNGLWLQAQASAFLRRALENHSDYSLFFRDRNYATNHPDGSSPALDVFPDHAGLLWSLHLRWRPWQTYLLLPYRKIIVEEGWEFALNLRWAMGVEERFLPFGKWKAETAEVPDYLFIAFQLHRREWPLGPLGTSDCFVEAGFFPFMRSSYFPDLKHFWGNRAWLGPERYLHRQFLRLPYFAYSTTLPYVELHWQHHFGGLLTDRIPLVKRWNIATVFSVRSLVLQAHRPYAELAIGWENLGFGAFRFWRLDVTGGFSRLQKPDWGLFLSTALKLN